MINGTSAKVNESTRRLPIILIFLRLIILLATLTGRQLSIDAAIIVVPFANALSAITDSILAKSVKDRNQFSGNHLKSDSLKSIFLLIFFGTTSSINIPAKLRSRGIHANEGLFCILSRILRI